MLESFKVSKQSTKRILCVIARINNDLFASEIGKGIDILQAIIWVADVSALQNVVLRSQQ